MLFRPLPRPREGSGLHMGDNLIKIVYEGPDSTEMFSMVFKNPGRCIDMLNFLFQEVNFQHGYGEYSLKYYDLTGDQSVLKRIFYTDCDNPRTWYYLANFIGF